jgi:hypothetical protein
VQGGSCVQVSPASTLLLHDNSPVAFTMLIIAEIDSVATSKSLQVRWLAHSPAPTAHT